MTADGSHAQQAPVQSGERLRLLYIVSEDWYFLSHRLPMARAARDAGFEVHVATRVVDGGDTIRAEGFVLHPIPFARGRLSPLTTLRTVRALRELHRRIAPALVHHVSVQVSVLGTIAALGRPARLINAMTGFGFVFTSGSALARALRPLARSIIRVLFNRRAALVLVQNDDDRRAMLANGIDEDRIVLIPGSGVDTARFSPTREPPEPLTVVFVGRLLDDKGIRTLVAGHRLLRAEGCHLELLIAGTSDPANPASVSDAEAASWNAEPGIRWLGHVQDTPALWARAHIAVLPSRREGMPKSLLEAASCARPMVATDVPGCREIVIEGETGLLVPVDDPPALARAIKRLAASPELRARMGKAARQRVVAHFSGETIGQMTVALYRRLLADQR